VSRLTPGGGVQPHENKPQEGGVLLGLLLGLMQHNRELHKGRFTIRIAQRLCRSLPGGRQR